MELKWNKFDFLLIKLFYLRFIVLRRKGFEVSKLLVVGAKTEYKHGITMIKEFKYMVC